jgi:phytoene/squalene synthetase
MEDGSFPIETVADLKNAIRAYGRAKDKEKAKAHIIKRARALMEEGAIPEEWLKDLGKSLEEDLDVEVKTEDDPEFLANLMEFELLSTEEEIKSLEED